jgi:curved DNA-binding protein CbpA
MQRDPPFYAVLGLHRGASLKEIRAAYKERALAFHPDKNPGGEKAFKAIATAYDTLKDAGKRSAYDAEFNRQQQQSSSAAPASRPHRTPAQEQAAADNIMRDAFADYRRSAMAGNKSRPHDWYRRKTEEQENDLPSASASSSWMPQAGGAASSCQGAAHRFASSRGGNGSGSAPTPPPRGSRDHAQPSSSASAAGRSAAAPDAEDAPEPPGFRPWKPASEAPQPSAAELLAKQKRQREAEEAVRRAADLRSEAAAAKERMLREARERRRRKVRWSGCGKRPSRGRQSGTTCRCARRARPPTRYEKRSPGGTFQR